MCVKTIQILKYINRQDSLNKAFLCNVAIQDVYDWNAFPKQSNEAVKANREQQNPVFHLLFWLFTYHHFPIDWSCWFQHLLFYLYLKNQYSLKNALGNKSCRNCGEMPVYTDKKIQKRAKCSGYFSWDTSARDWPHFGNISFITLYYL